jgi:hypothetical protein
MPQGLGNSPIGHPRISRLGQAEWHGEGAWLQDERARAPALRSSREQAYAPRIVTSPNRLSSLSVDVVDAIVPLLVAVAAALFGAGAVVVVLGAAAGAVVAKALRIFVESRLSRQEVAKAERDLFAQGVSPVLVASALGERGYYDVGVDHEAANVLAELDATDNWRPGEYVRREVDDALHTWLSSAIKDNACSVLVVLCYSSGVWCRAKSARSIGWWQVWQ